MNARSLSSLLKSRSISFDLHFYPSCESTNISAALLFSKGIAGDALVVALRQRAGKGRLGRAWVSDSDEGVWASFALASCKNPQHALRAIALAIMETLVNRGAEASLKWPNDVLAGELKIAGILAEKASGPQNPEGLVLGFGVNINQKAESFPDEIKTIATSLALATGNTFECENILLDILSTFNALYSKAEEECFSLYKKSLSTIGRNITLESRKVFAESLQNDGALIIINEKGERETVYSGTVRHR